MSEERAAMRYYVVTPPYERYSSSIYDPGEYGCDVVEVEAPTKKQAKVKGLRELRRTHSHWIRDYCDGNPFKGLEVIPW
jgi:hypothetical protein